jgi:hypothetical protein
MINISDRFQTTARHPATSFVSNRCPQAGAFSTSILDIPRQTDAKHVPTPKDVLIAMVAHSAYGTTPAAQTPRFSVNGYNQSSPPLTTSLSAGETWQLLLLLHCYSQ